MVRSMGLGVPHHLVGASGSGVCQVPVAGAAAGVVPAPERGAPGIRVELRRRQPASPRVGRPPGVRHRRRPGPRLPGARLPEAVAELHLVAQPPGSRRQQPFRWRLPRPGQHLSDRSIAPAGGRPARSGRRHRVGGLLLHRDAELGGRSRRPRQRLRRHGRQVPRAVSDDHGRVEQLRLLRPESTGSSTTGSPTRPEPASRSGCRAWSARSRPCRPSLSPVETSTGYSVSASASPG